jgi:hypothetical protein
MADLIALVLALRCASPSVEIKKDWSTRIAPIISLKLLGRLSPVPNLLSRGKGTLSSSTNKLSLLLVIVYGLAVLKFL